MKALVSASDRCFFWYRRSVDYVEIAHLPSRAEAETIGHALDQYEIPFLVQSHDVGVFGPGMTGWTPGGAALLVPSDKVAKVRKLLTCVVQPLDDGVLGDDVLYEDAKDDDDPGNVPK